MKGWDDFFGSATSGNSPAPRPPRRRAARKNAMMEIRSMIDEIKRMPLEDWGLKSSHEALREQQKNVRSSYCGAYRVEGSHYTSAHKEELGFRIKVYPRLNDAMKKGGPGAPMIRDAIDYYAIN
ncbi:unnamed protein product, partial [Mesorhabditis spiculigera]